VRRLQVVFAPDGGFHIASASGETDWQRHADGRLITAAAAPPHPPRREDGQPVDVVAFHAFLASVGLSLGPSYRLLSDFHSGPSGASATVGSDANGSGIVDPLLLDACLQIIGGPDWLAARDSAAQGVRASMPMHLARLTLTRALPGRVTVTVSGGPAGADRMAADTIEMDVTIADDGSSSGEPLLTIEDFTIRRMTEATLGGNASITGIYAVTWRKAPIEPAALPSGGTLLTGDGTSDRPDPAAFVAGLAAIQSNRGPVWCRSRPGSPADALLEGLALTAGLEQPDRIGGITSGTSGLAGEIMRWQGQQARVARLTQIAPPEATATRFSPRADRSYLITGGLGGLGLATARWLAAADAGGLLLIGRRSVADAGVLAELSSAGCAVAYRSADIADETALRQAMDDGLASLPPLDGVFHAAGTLDDSTIDRLDAARAAAVIAVKAGGAWALHRLSVDRQSSLFVLYGSLAGLTGSAGQAAYAAANRYLDQLADWRSAQNLPALSIAWGPWAEVGMASRMDAAYRERTRSRGLRAMPPAVALDALGRVLAAPHVGPAVVIASIDWDAMAASGQCPALFADLLPRMTDTASSGQRARIATMDPAERGQALLDLVARHAASVLDLPADAPPDRCTPLREIGLDSLAAVDLRGALGRALATPLPAVLVFDYPTITDIALYLDALLFPPESTPPPDPEPLPDPGDFADVLSELAELSEVEAANMLRGA
jgi:NAD(P)-dependent dehydrogenase (short-subunit alcohol dehydrogenase family)